MSGTKATTRDPRVVLDVSSPKALPDEQVVATLRQFSAAKSSEPRYLSISRQRSAYPVALKWGIKSLDGVNVSDSDLGGSDISPSAFGRPIKITHCQLTNVELEQSRFRKVEFRDCHLDRVGLRDSAFSQVRFENVTLKASDLRHATFDHAEIRDSVFDGCRAERTGIRNSQIVETRFLGRFGHTFFVDCELAAVDFSESSPSELTFSGGSLRDVQFPLDRDWVAVTSHDFAAITRDLLGGLSPTSRAYLAVFVGHDEPLDDHAPWIIGRGFLAPLTRDERAAVLAALRPHALSTFSSPRA